MNSLRLIKERRKRSERRKKEQRKLERRQGPRREEESSRDQNHQTQDSYNTATHTNAGLENTIRNDLAQTIAQSLKISIDLGEEIVVMQKHKLIQKNESSITAFATCFGLCLFAMLEAFSPGSVHPLGIPDVLWKAFFMMIMAVTLIPSLKFAVNIARNYFHKSKP